MRTAPSSPPPTNKERPAAPPLDLEHWWETAGPGLRSSDFNAAMVHFYRGEVSRSNSWRSRLDVTTNWAVVTAGAALSFAFSDPSRSPTVILINTFLLLLFLFIEARRYRYYELWTYRVRLLETNYFTGLLSPPFVPHSDWAQKISDSLKHPAFPISLLEAFGRRYRRNYAPIFLILAFSWVGKVFLHPYPATSFNQFVNRSALGPISGPTMLTIGLIFNAALIAVGILTINLRRSTGEVFDEQTQGWVRRFWQRLRHGVWEAFEVELHVPHLPRLDTRKQLAYIISDAVEQIGRVILKDLDRGVTMLKGVGMYTGREHGILLCAVQANQISLLKRLVYGIDARAFVIITPVSEIRGEGFRPLEA
ncbi:MAG: DUF2270 domain-containing protein [Chloroflexota bacterium]